MDVFAFFSRNAALALLVTLIGCSAPDEETVVIDDDNEPYSADGIDAWGAAFEDRASGKGDEAGCSGVVVPDQSGFGGRVALTFDDGPNPETTPQVLDTLKEHGIRATFFINGKRVNSDAARSVLKRIVDEGHILANHSHNHQNLKTLDLAAVEAEVDRTHQIIEDQGVQPTYFRFPFGSSSCATADLVRSFGYRVSGWHTDSADWCFASSTGGVGHCAESTFKWVPDSMRDDMSGFVMDQVQSKNGGILLFHDIHQNTANAIGGIINQLTERGFTFVNIDDVSTFPLLNSDDLGDFPWTGTVCANDGECSFGDGASCHTFTGDSGPAGFCTVACEGFCDDFPGRAPTFCVSLDGGQSGNCVAKAHDTNMQCGGIPGTHATEMRRHVGSSSAPASTATVCVPPQ